MQYVLVHGGATTGRYWDWVLPHLDGPALAPDLPGRGGHPADLGTLTVDEAADSVVRDVLASPTIGPAEVTLVAHSSGGLEIPGIVRGLGPQRVRAIVLNAASVPPEGGNGFDCMQERHRVAALQALEAAEATKTPIITPRPRPESLRSSSGEELTEEQLAFVADPVRSVEDSFNLYSTPVRWASIAEVPVTYVVNLSDRAVPPALQREMADRLPGPTKVVDLDCGHLAAVTRPKALARLICDA